MLFFGGAARGGGVLVRAALLLLVVIGDVSREWAVWLLFSLVSRFFFYVFVNSLLRLRCAGVLSLEGFESVF